MTLAFIDLVNAELKRRHPRLVTSVGWKARSALTSPPCVRWIAGDAEYGPPMQRDDALSQPLAGRVLKYSVECWGADPEESQLLVKRVVRALHALGTGASYSVEGESWEGLEGSGSQILGEMATLTVGIRDDVTEGEETIVAAPNPTAPPTGGFT